jgi:hypothetical protein
MIEGDRSEIGNHNLVPASEEELTNEQRAEMEKAMEAYRMACLGAFSVTRSGTTIKKYELPSIHPLEEEDRDQRLAQLVGQSVAQSMIKQGPVMANQIHNQVMESLKAGELSRKGPVYTNSTAIGTAKVTELTGNQLPFNGSTASEIAGSSKAPLKAVITDATNTSSSANTDSGVTPFPLGWDPSTGLGMPPNFGASTSQNSGGVQPSASQPMTFQQASSASQLMTFQQSPSAS